MTYCVARLYATGLGPLVGSHTRGGKQLETPAVPHTSVLYLVVPSAARGGAAIAVSGYKFPTASPFNLRRRGSNPIKEIE